ncbi:MAG: hypothetical protein RI996_428 [Candidatus Parcubacteria bacterium]|jgi:hypothetical protein
MPLSSEALHRAKTLAAEDATIVLYGRLHIEHTEHYLSLINYCQGAARRLGKEELLIEIDSPGGAIGIFSLFKTYLPKTGLPVRTRVVGGRSAQSSAAMIFLLGNNREVETSSSLLFHHISSPNGFKTSNWRKNKRWQRKYDFDPYFATDDKSDCPWIDFFIEKTGLSRDFTENLFVADREMFVKEIVELKIATTIPDVPQPWHELLYPLHTKPYGGT